MTSLPATLVEAQALSFARETIKHARRGSWSETPWSGHAPLTAEAGSSVVQHLMWQAVLGPAVNRMKLIAMARAGNADAGDVLKAVIIEMKSRRQELPTELETYNMEVLAGLHRQQAGPKKKNKLMRNICIAATVAAVVDRFGLPATGRSPQRRSACSIVAEALQEGGMALGYKAVESIWATFARAMPTVPGWASSLPF